MRNLTKIISVFITTVFLLASISTSANAGKRITTNVQMVEREAEYQLG